MRRLLALLGIASLGAWPAMPARAEQQCVNDTATRNRCSAGLPAQLADDIAATQQTAVWCWAASAQMIFRHYGLQLTQPQIVAAVYGEAIPRTADGPAMRRMLDARYADATGTQWRVRFRFIQPSLTAIVPELSADNPLLITTSHHAMVLTAVNYYVYPQTGAWRTAAVIVRDPWPQASTQRSAAGPARRMLSAAEFSDVNAIVRVYVERVT